MKSIKVFLVVTLCLILLQSCSKSDDIIGGENSNLETVSFEADEKSLIRNPAMGWTMYDDANDEVADATTYWQTQDEIARNYASCFYVRWRWSDMEPEEGKYAWEYNDNFKALINGALDRGLKLAFRIYVNGQDNLRPGTPQFVFDAGAKNYEVDKYGGGKNITPYADDSVFHEKFSNFVKAFAEEFDNPDIVNYVDGFNLGWWGEGHHIKYMNPANKINTFEWIINLYGNAFKKVPLVITLGTEIGIDFENQFAFEGQNYSPRKDGLGSQWFPESQQQLLRSFYKDAMIITEAAYWGGGSIQYANNIDNQYHWDTWSDYYKQVVNEALSVNSNFLDLREAVESARYVNEAKDQVEKFIEQGGYRIYPVKVEFNKEISTTSDLKVVHSWENIGVGYLPNNNRRWNYKYKVATALLNADKSVVKQWISESAEPSEWVKGEIIEYKENLNLAGISPGSYELSIAIVDSSKDNKPGINLAIQNKSLLTSDGWLKVGQVKIQ